MIGGGKGRRVPRKREKESESPYSLSTCITLPRIWIERNFDCVSKSQGTLKWGTRGPSTTPRKSCLEWNQYTYFKTTIGASDHVNKNRQGLPSCYKHLYNLGKIHKNDFQILNNRQYRPNSWEKENKSDELYWHSGFFGGGGGWRVVDFLDYRVRRRI